MAGFRGPSQQSPRNTYAGVAGADLSNAPSGPVPFTSQFGLPIARPRIWHAGGNEPGVPGGVPGTPYKAVASGNPAVATHPSYSEKQPYGGSEGVGLSQFGSPRPLNVGQETAFRRNAAPTGGANDKLIASDRHPMAKVGYENSGRRSGETDPPMDGPARPSYTLVQRTINYQQGTDKDAATDDLTRDYSRNDSGMYLGEQGTGWYPVYGGTPGLYQEYGSYQGIAPNTPGYNPVTGETQGIVSPAAQGGAGDGPHSGWSGPPHGLHSPSLPDYTQTIGRYLAIPQMAAPRIDRPSNSPIAGQSYSQTVIPQGQTGTVAQNVNVSGGVNFNQRSRSNGWRGQAAP